MKQIFLSIIAFIILIPSALAQTTSCHLQLDVYKFQEIAEPEPIEIKKVSALLQTSKSKTTIKAKTQNELPYFENLPAGNYNAVVSMKGYKVTTKEIDFDCSRVNDQNIVSAVIFLWEGDAKETVKMNGGAFQAIGTANGDDSNQLKKAPVKTSEETLTVDPLKTVPAVRGQETYISNPEGKKAINGYATYLPKPAYPRAASVVKASGAVLVQVLIDEIGRVVSAEAISGHPLLRAASVNAAREAKFGQTRLQGMPVQVSGIVTYNFIP
jgi:outer membrane biosynthesis protein TonB